MPTSTGTGLHRRIPRFERVIIETTGLVDTGAVLLEQAGIVAERYERSSVVCTVDAVHGAHALAALRA